MIYIGKDGDDSVTSNNQPDEIAVGIIVEALRLDIISGRLSPGDEINSVELANRFGTSRTPVREALLILDRYGLVSLTARKRPRVAGVSVEAIRDLYELRRALHMYISDAIVKRASDNDLIHLLQQAEVLLDNVRADSLEEQFVRIEAYLDVEYDLCGNALVIETLSLLKWKIGWFRRLALMTPAQLRRIGEDRLRVAQAYMERDSALAAALNSSMLQRGAEYSASNFLAKWGRGS